MAGTQVRGGQIKDRNIDSSKIKTNTITDEHIATNAAIAESKLNINWAAHGQEILSSKKVVDFVQVNNVDVSDVSSINVTDRNIFGGTTPSHTTSDPSDVEGVIVDEPKNKISIRDSVSGDPIMDSHGHEVYGRMIYDDGTSKFIINFYTDEGGVETPFTMPSATTINFQYAQRFNLQSINEMFAANEKFVEGAADATAHLNIEQLAKDLYGAGFTLDRTGNAKLIKSVVDQIIEERNARQSADLTLQSNIDSEADARAFAVSSVRADLASQSTGKGASLIGIEDADGILNAQNVEAALRELWYKANALEEGSTNAEIMAARSSTLTGDHSTLDDRLESAEAYSKAISDEIVEARDGSPSLKSRFDDIKNVNDFQDIAINEEIANREAAIELITTEFGFSGVLRGQVSAGTGMDLNYTEVIAYNVNGKRLQADPGTVTISAADATNPRIDIVIIDSTSTVSVIAGTPSATPIAPFTPVGAVLLAQVSVAANATSIVAEDIIDSRLPLATGTEIQLARGGFPALNDRFTVFEAEDMQIYANLNQEITDRQNADSNLQDQITALSANLLTETTNRQNADSVIQSELDSTQEELANYKTSNDTRVSNIETEINNARGVLGSIDERLDVSINEDGTIKPESVHRHKKYITTIDANTSIVNMPQGETYTAGDGSLNVFVNGILQANGINFTEDVSGTFVDFGTDQLLAGDIVVIEYIVY